MPTPVGAVGDYEWSTSATDESCANPFNGGGYLDLAGFGFGPDPLVTGDGVLYTALSSREFGYYEDTQSGISFTDDGYLVYGGIDNWSGDVGTPQELPDTTVPNGVAAMLWQDMQIVHDAPSGAGVTVATAGAGLGIIEFDNLRKADDAAGAQGTYDLEVFAVTGSRDLVFAYDNVTGPLTGVTVGAEDQTGEHGSALVNLGDASSTIEDDTVVCGTYVKDDSPVTFTYQVTVDDDVIEGQVLRNRLTHTVDNPGAKAVRLSNFVSVVEGAQPPAIKVIKKRDARERGADGVVVFKRPSAVSDERLTVFYDVLGTAVAGTDYRALDGSITFQPGKVRAREYVKAVNRKGQQGVRRVRIVLTEGDSYSVGAPKVAVVKIRDARRRR